MFQHRFQPHKSLQLVFNSQSLSLSHPLTLFSSPSLPLSLSVETHCSSSANREICVLCLCRIGLEKRQREQREE